MCELSGRRRPRPTRQSRTHLSPMMLGAVLAVLTFTSPARADRFELKDGRILSGKVVHTDTHNDGQREQTRLAIEIEPGVLVRIYQSDLARGGQVKTDDREEEYRKRVATLPETADAHYRMAQWCTEQGLRDLSRAHYMRTIDLDPNHKLARAAVDHTLSSATGRWIKREDQMAERGRIYHQGKWQYPEYIPMDEQAELEKKERAALQKEINRWHNDFLRGTADKAQQAAVQLSALDNPLAIDYVTQLLLGKQKGGVSPATPALKLLYIAFLSRFDAPLAAVPMARVSVMDADQSVRVAALDALTRQGRTAAIPVIASYLRSPNNTVVNRAGYALGQLNAIEVVLPLVDALTTKHEFQGAANDTYSGGGLALGGSKKQVVELKNESVLAALSQVTGQGQLGYDKSSWRAWYASVYAPPADDLRRDL